MTRPGTNIVTAHGTVDGAQLAELQHTYDTSALLRAVDDIDQLVIAMMADGGVREALLRLHGMLSTVLSSSGLTVMAEDETLPELASDLAAELQQAISTLKHILELAEPVAKLAIE